MSPDPARTPDAGAQRPPTADPLPGYPTLDRTSEPWRGSFPGMGTVEVHGDGQVSVQPDRPDDAEAARALALGWGEPLSLARRGLLLSAGASLCGPQCHEALLVRGSAHDVAMVVLVLAHEGWRLVANIPAPLRWEEGRLVAHPREAPLLASDRRATRYAWDTAPLGSDTDTVAVSVPRVSEPVPLAGVLVVEQSKAGDTYDLTVLRGHERFKEAASLQLNGALSGPDGAADPSTVMAGHLALATLPFARLMLDGTPGSDQVAALGHWWSGLVGQL